METLRTTEPLRVGSVVLVVVERVRVEPWQAGGGVHVHAYAAPRAIVVDDGGRRYALDLDGQEIPLQPLIEEVAGLADAHRSPG